MFEQLRIVCYNGDRSLTLVVLAEIWELGV